MKPSERINELWNGGPKIESVIAYLDEAEERRHPIAKAHPAPTLSPGADNPSRCQGAAPDGAGLAFCDLLPGHSGPHRVRLSENVESAIVELERDSLREQLADSQAERETSNRIIDSLRGELTEAQSLLVLAETQRSEAMVELERVRAENARLVEVDRVHNEMVDALTRHPSEAKKEHDAAVATIEQCMTELAARAEAGDAAVAKLTESERLASELREEIARLKTDLSWGRGWHRERKDKMQAVVEAAVHYHASGDQREREVLGEALSALDALPKNGEAPDHPEPAEPNWAALAGDYAGQIELLRAELEKLRDILAGSNAALVDVRADRDALRAELAKQEAVVDAARAVLSKLKTFGEVQYHAHSGCPACAESKSLEAHLSALEQPQAEPGRDCLDCGFDYCVKIEPGREIVVGSTWRSKLSGTDRKVSVVGDGRVIAVDSRGMPENWDAAVFANSNTHVSDPPVSEGEG